MKHVVSVGTDTATICAFDGSLLPPNVDLLLMKDPMKVMEQLQAEECLWFGGTGGDGTHVVQVLVDEPEDLPSSASIVHQGKLHIASGTLWCCGAEYLARDPLKGSSFTPNGGLRRFGSMGGSIAVTPGYYRLTLAAYDAENSPAIPMRAGQVAMLLPPALQILGWIAAGISGLAIVVALSIKGIQAITSSPLFATGWNAFPILGAMFLVGVIMILAAKAIGRKLDESKMAQETRAQYHADRALQPDLILSLLRV